MPKQGRGSKPSSRHDIKCESNWPASNDFCSTRESSRCGHSPRLTHDYIQDKQISALTQELSHLRKVLEVVDPDDIQAAIELLR